MQTPRPPSSDITTHIAVGLNAVVAVVDDERPKVLCVRRQKDTLGLPYGPFDPARHRTFDIGLREWVERQTSIALGYVEQLYTFGDRGREAPAAALNEAPAAGERIISVGYLALAPEPAAVNAADAQWRDWYEFFPWEDWRRGEPAVLSRFILPELENWAAASKKDAVQTARRERTRLAFGADGWEEERALDRYELMYEAGLVTEALRDRAETPDGAPCPEAAKAVSAQAISTQTGVSMSSDHRRILATAIGRLRGKLKYRPVIFRLTPPRFSLLMLQKTVEAIIGYPLHKQNFRRSVESGGLVSRTNETMQLASGRPAALFKPAFLTGKHSPAAGLTLPRLKARPIFFEN